MIAASVGGIEQRPRLVFVFSTRGSQWIGMGRQLYEEEPIFRETLRRCGCHISRHLGWRLDEEFTRDPGT
ncbi:MAG: acyltransferase domain-containing protein [Chloroflexota bacterium]